MLYPSGPQPFWHQGLILWKTIFPRTRVGGWFQDDSSTLHLVCAWFLLLLHQFHLRSSALIRSQRLGSSALPYHYLSSRTIWLWNVLALKTYSLFLMDSFHTFTWQDWWGPSQPGSKCSLLLLLTSSYNSPSSHMNCSLVLDPRKPFYDSFAFFTFAQTVPSV